MADPVIDPVLEARGFCSQCEQYYPLSYIWLAMDLCEGCAEERDAEHTERMCTSCDFVFVVTRDFASNNECRNCAQDDFPYMDDDFNLWETPLGDHEFWCLTCSRRVSRGFDELVWDPTEDVCMDCAARQNRDDPENMVLNRVATANVQSDPLPENLLPENPLMVPATFVDNNNGFDVPLPHWRLRRVVELLWDRGIGDLEDITELWTNVERAQDMARHQAYELNPPRRRRPVGPDGEPTGDPTDSDDENGAPTRTFAGRLFSPESVISDPYSDEDQRGRT